MFSKIGIIGLGLIGGSLAKALKNRCEISNIVAANRNEDVLKIAYSEGVIKEYATDVTDIFEGCDIVFICTPVDKTFEYTQKLIPFVSSSCIVTDVGSTKGNLFIQMSSLSDKISFIGGHPMTGAEKFRYQASKEHLFENAYYMLTPNESIPLSRVNEFKELITTIGAIPIVVSPFEHDHIVAAISHVPHIIASAIVNTVKSLDSKNKYMHTLAAGGFKDITRIASSSPSMWESICLDNRNEIIDVLSNFEEVIREIKNSLEAENMKEVYSYFKDAKEYRDSFSGITPGQFVNLFDIIVDVVDKPGSIAIIAVLFSSNNINIKNLSIVNNREGENGVLHISFSSEEQRQRGICLLKDMNYEVYIK